MSAPARLLLFLVILSMIGPTRTGAQDAVSQVIAPAGLEVMVTPRWDLYSNTVVVAEVVELVTVEEVKIAGHIVIASGSPARARVAIAKPPASFGRSGELLIEMIEVTAVDGRTIPLLGEHRAKGASHRATVVLLSILGGPLCGRLQDGAPARLAPGVILRAKTERETTIKVTP